MIYTFIKRHLRFFTRTCPPAVVSGVLLTAAFPSIELAWIAWIALVPLLTATSGVSLKQGLAAGFITGIIHYVTLLYWLVPTLARYGGLPVLGAVGLFLLLAGYLALYIGTFGMIMAGLDGCPAFRVLAAPVAWTGLEYLRASLFTGFPWELAGYSQYKTIPLIQIADITGVYGVSFLVVFANAVAAYLLQSSSGRHCLLKSGSWKKTISLVALFVAVSGSAWTYGTWRLKAIRPVLEQAPKIKVAVLQGNIPQDHKWDNAFRVATIEKYINLSRLAAGLHPDLIVMPETAMPFYFLYDRQGTSAVLNCARETGAWLLVGAPAAVTGNTTKFYNSAYLVTPEGETAGRYDKAHLVPFGEYVPLGPLRRFLPFIEKLVMGAVGDFSPGKHGKTLDMGNSRLGVQICYEIIFPGESRCAVKNGAMLLANITNDAWYGKSSAPYQHFSMVVFRAIETRRSVVRAANTGISGFIESTGAVRGTTQIFVETLETGNMPLLDSQTFYSMHGDIFAGVCTMGLFCILWYIYRFVDGQPLKKHRTIKS